MREAKVEIGMLTEQKKWNFKVTENLHLCKYLQSTLFMPPFDAMANLILTTI